MLSLYDQVKVALEEIRLAKQDGTVTKLEWMGITGELLEAASIVLDRLSDRQQHFEGLVQSCERLYDEYTDQIDIPKVPKWLEKRLFEAGKKFLRPGIVILYDFLGE